jgi:glycyl-tRNA synthetase alpha chain
VEQSTFNFEHANVPKLFELFDFYESEANAPDGKETAAARL